MPPVVSVCLSTRNRANLLPRLFDALAAQSLPPTDFEVVVVDDGSTDGTPDVLAQLGERAAPALRVLRREISRGPAAGRNEAWRVASAPVVAFTDDDCVPSRSWLAAGLHSMGDARRVVSGRVAPNPEQVHRDGPFARRLVVGPAERRWYATANVFYRRADLERLGGFDERFGSAACEDTDLGLRAEADGVDVVFGDAAVVFHDVQLAGVSPRVRDQRRWADMALLLSNHPALRRELLYRGLFWRRSHAELLALLVGLIAAPRAPVALALAMPWLHGKLCQGAAPDGFAPTVASLPGLLAVDAAELVAALVGSVRYRTLVL